MVPYIYSLFQPRSIVDVGCGTGHWVGEFMNCGVERALGIDGDYVPLERLEIPKDCFLSRDLSKKLEIQQTFDLAISLEVAEHLPPGRAESFVADLCALAPIVVFSAAIPGQGGTGHINEQWPEYWAGLFRNNGMVTIDCVRSKLWHDSNVAYHYSQNTIVYALPEVLDRMPGLREHAVTGENPALSRVHPEKWLRSLQLERIGLKRYLRAFPGIIRCAISKRL